jgi:hypothetical protein
LLAADRNYHDRDQRQRGEPSTPASPPGRQPECIESKKIIKTSGYDSYGLIEVSARIEHPGLYFMQSMLNMQSLINGGENGEYNNPGHR